MVASVAVAVAFGAARYEFAHGRADDFHHPATAASPERSAPRQDLRGSTLTLVPMDSTPPALVARVARRLARGYHVRIRVLPSIRSTALAVDDDRHQLTGEQLTAQLWRRYRGDPVVGITDADLYWASNPDWRWAFGVIQPSGRAVISTARMDPANYGKRHDPATVERRLTAMTARYLARLAFHRAPASSDPRSAVRASLLGLDDLDQMTPWVCPSRPGSRRAC